MSQAAAKTGVGPTVLVAIEQHFPEKERIIEDDLAYRILPFGMIVFVKLTRSGWVKDWMVRETEKDVPGIWSGIMYRKLYIDGKLSDSAAQITAPSSSPCDTSRTGLPPVLSQWSAIHLTAQPSGHDHRQSRWFFKFH